MRYDPQTLDPILDDLMIGQDNARRQAELAALRRRQQAPVQPIPGTQQPEAPIAPPVATQGRIDPFAPGATVPDATDGLTPQQRLSSLPETMRRDLERRRILGDVMSLSGFDPIRKSGEAMSTGVTDVLSDIYGMSDGSSDGDSLADLRKEAFAQEKDLRSEFLKTTADWRVVEDSWNKLQANINTGTGPGDMAVVFSFMKMQDPNSAVREGEYATAENAGSATQRVIGIYNRLLEGDRLTPQQRAEFLQTAANLRNKSYEGYNAQLNRTSELAKSYQLNPERVARRYGREGRVEVPDVAASSQRTARPNPDAVWDEKLQVWTMEVPDG